MSSIEIANWIRSKLTEAQVRSVAEGRSLVGDLIDIPDDWDIDAIIEAVDSLNA